MDAPSQLAASTIDPKLLARVVKGDQQAFGQLFDQSSAFLYTLALRILGTREEAADLLQEVYLEVWRKVARYDVGRGTPIAWLITLTRSRAIDRLRARTSRTQHQTGEPHSASTTSQTADRQPAPFEAQADQELRNRVRSALGHLPQEQHGVIELAYYSGLSHLEITEQLNQPLGTVKTRIKVGMYKLRELLRPCWEQGERA